MRIRELLGGGRGFWLGIAAAGVLTLVLLFMWALPAYTGAKQSRTSLDQVYTDLKLHKAKAKEIPSPRTLKDREEFREWLNDQAKIVDGFFVERAALLDGTFTGDPSPRPEDFKEAYSERLETRRTWFEQIKKETEIVNPGGAFISYGWLRSKDLPGRETYAEVRRGYWSRHFLYERFYEAKVAKVARVSIGQVGKISARFNGLHFSADVVIAPDRLKGLLDKMLVVTPERTLPVFVLEEMEIEGMPETAGPNARCAVKLAGYILVPGRP